MNPTIEQILKTKSQRRQRLAKMSFEEKLEVLRQLRDFGREARAVRKRLALEAKVGD